MPKIEIYCRGRLDARWSDWFQGLTIEPVAPDRTSLSGEVPDNAAVYGVLSTMSSLGLTLISCYVKPDHGADVNPPSSPSISPSSSKSNSELTLAGHVDERWSHHACEILTGRQAPPITRPLAPCSSRPASKLGRPPAP